MNRITMVAWLALLASSGCASMPLPFTKPAGEAPQTYAERKQNAVAAFEKQRDKAQVQAAVNCWERGEIQKSQAMLEAILQRNPSDVTARLRLAEIYASQNDLGAAIEHLQLCLQHAPEHAEVHHALGMIYSEHPETEPEARQHLQRACELEPQNEIYLTAAHAAGN